MGNVFIQTNAISKQKQDRNTRFAPKKLLLIRVVLFCFSVSIQYSSWHINSGEQLLGDDVLEIEIVINDHAHRESTKCFKKKEQKMSSSEIEGCRYAVFRRVLRDSTPHFVSRSVRPFISLSVLLVIFSYSKSLQVIHSHCKSY